MAATHDASQSTLHSLQRRECHTGVSTLPGSIGGITQRRRQARTSTVRSMYGNTPPPPRACPTPLQCQPSRGVHHRRSRKKQRNDHKGRPQCRERHARRLRHSRSASDKRTHWYDVFYERAHSTAIPAWIQEGYKRALVHLMLVGGVGGDYLRKGEPQQRSARPNSQGEPRGSVLLKGRAWRKKKRRNKKRSRERGQTKGNRNGSKASEVLSARVASTEAQYHDNMVNVLPDNEQPTTRVTIINTGDNAPHASDLGVARVAAYESNESTIINPAKIRIALDQQRGADDWDWCSHPPLVNILEVWHIDERLASVLASDEEIHPWTVIPGVYYRETPQVILKEEGTFRPVRPTRQMCKAPLASITKNRMSLQKIEAMMTVERRKWLKWLNGATLASYVHDRSPGTYVGRYMDDERERLTEWDVLESTNALGLTMPVFKVPKGEEARLIIDCRQLNSQLPRPGHMELPDLHQVYERLLSCNYISQYDGKSYFYQIPLQPNARDFFQVRLGGIRGNFTKHRLTVLPMGYSYAPAIAQAISNTVLEAALQGESAVIGFAWVDNFLFGSNDREALHRTTEKFKTLCARVNIELKDERVEGATEMELLGAKIDVKKGTIGISGKLREGLVAEGRKLEQQTKVTRREVYAALGKVLWIYWAITRRPLATCERLLIIMREIGQEIQQGAYWDAHTTVTKPAELFGLLSEAAKEGHGRKAVIRNKLTENTAWTDASTTALGYMISRQDVGTVGWCAEGPKGCIFVRELWAAAKMVVALSWQGGGTVVGDNQAAIRALEAGHSSSTAGNAILSEMIRRMGPWKVELTWTESANQSADDLSRRLYSVMPKAGPWRERTTFRWWPRERAEGEEIKGGGAQLYNCCQPHKE
jgi:hypothetical protein